MKLLIEIEGLSNSEVLEGMGFKIIDDCLYINDVLMTDVEGNTKIKPNEVLAIGKINGKIQVITDISQLEGLMKGD